MAAPIPPVQSYTQPYAQPPAQSYMQPNVLTPPSSVASLSQMAVNPMGAVNAANITSPNAPANASANANATANATFAPAPAPAPPAATAVNSPMNFERPNTGVLTPPNKSDLPPSGDTFEQQNKPPSVPRPSKKGQTGINLVLLGQVAVCAVAAFYLGKGLKGIGGALAKVFNR